METGVEMFKSKRLLKEIYSGFLAPKKHALVLTVAYAAYVVDFNGERGIMLAEAERLIVRYLDYSWEELENLRKKLLNNKEECWKFLESEIN